VKPELRTTMAGELHDAASGGSLTSPPLNVHVIARPIEGGGFPLQRPHLPNFAFNMAASSRSVWMICLSCKSRGPITAQN
jgi:hypothetical protein